jgi:hypothetical protein
MVGASQRCPPPHWGGNFLGRKENGHWPAVRSFFWGGGDGLRTSKSFCCVRRVSSLLFFFLGPGKERGRFVCAALRQNKIWRCCKEPPKAFCKQVTALKGRFYLSEAPKGGTLALSWGKDTKATGKRMPHPPASNQASKPVGCSVRLRK